MQPHHITMNDHKEMVFTEKEIRDVLSHHHTPIHYYHGDKMVENAKSMMTNFQRYFPTYTNYFAVKATPNPHLMKLLRDVGMGADCSSMAELVLSEKVGFRGEEIMLTSNNTPKEEYQKAFELGAIINLDDYTQIEYLYESLGGKMPELISFRYNPGPLKKGNDIIGKPEEAKFGFTREGLVRGYKKLQELGVQRFGLHCMVASNELHVDYFEETANLLFKTVRELTQELNIHFELVNLGGGIGIPYKPDQKPIDFQELTDLIHQSYQTNIIQHGLKPLKKLVTECGRVITGPYGVLITKAIHSKSTYKEYIGVDACMANLMRPGMYGAYHHITVIKNQTPSSSPISTKTYDIVGSLCENNDKFAIDRELPEIVRDDILVIHDSGAHGHSMGFNYNGKLRSAEYLLLQNNIKCIRREETFDDLFATLTFP
ncbi:group IV decarboxylase [Tieghemostelium lacteum]|uniref:Group IV decarboxylase n=1 Tax=Tieghemostelium lacteum TaxID=361077 RepID=A0A151ZJB1_TIELA|nr:group IV decarboxylase [Tieghemostelium lacteum]|eukprot:KYQ94088.1 group IV decarboxylase [Tieghemostelium lacteum]